MPGSWLGARAVTCGCARTLARLLLNHLCSSVSEATLQGAMLAEASAGLRAWAWGVSGNLWCRSPPPLCAALLASTVECEEPRGIGPHPGACIRGRGTYRQAPRLALASLSIWSSLVLPPARRDRKHWSPWVWGSSFWRERAGANVASRLPVEQLLLAPGPWGAATAAMLVTVLTTENSMALRGAEDAGSPSRQVASRAPHTHRATAFPATLPRPRSPGGHRGRDRDPPIPSLVEQAPTEMGGLAAEHSLWSGKKRCEGDEREL